LNLIDRYLIRECLPAFLVALGIFTFLLALQPMLEKAQDLLAKGVDLPTVGWMLVLLLPQALALTIPMAFLTGLLMGLGRLSADREAMALLASGVSPARLLRPVLAASVLAALATFYVLSDLVPDANQAWRQRAFELVAQRSAAEVKPGLFYEGFPNKVLFIRDHLPGGGWSGVMLADTSQPGRPLITLAPEGLLELDEVRQEVAIVLKGESVRYLPGDEPGIYDTSRATDLRFAIPADTVFPDASTLARGTREMRLSELRAAEAARRAAGESPHNEIMWRHQMFAFPAACLVFALIGVALGLHTRREGKLGGFMLGIGVIFVYHALNTLAEGRTKAGDFPAEWARWVSNVVLGAVGLAAMWWRMRATGHALNVGRPGWWRRSAADGTAAAPGRTRPPGVLIVLRVPDLRLPRPRLLDLYLLRRYAAVFALASVAILVLYYIGAFIDRSEKLFKGQADAGMLAGFLFYSTPQFIVYLAPMAVLVAVLATLGGLIRTGELVVMRACGISLYRAALPLILAGLVWSGGLFYLEDRVLAHANVEAERLDNHIRSGMAPGMQPVASTNWLADGRGRIFHYLAYDTRQQRLHNLSIFQVDGKTFELSSHTFAERVQYDGHAWQSSRGWSQHFLRPDASRRETFDLRPMNLPPPENFTGSEPQQAELMTFGELRRHIDRLAQSGYNLAESRMELWERLAFPLVACVMTLVGIPFAMTVGRRGALYGVGLAIIVASAYWLLNTLFLAIGRADLLPAPLAAWAANLLCLAGAGYLTLSVRT
jgi:LPS export ABC transporter permease LptG/LPS export ABC transporter permease LptF